MEFGTTSRMLASVQAHRIAMIENVLQGCQEAAHRCPRDLAVGILALLASTPFEPPLSLSSILATHPSRVKVGGAGARSSHILVDVGTVVD